MSFSSVYNEFFSLFHLLFIFSIHIFNSSWIIYEILIFPFVLFHNFIFLYWLHLILFFSYDIFSIVFLYPFFISKPVFTTLILACNAPTESEYFSNIITRSVAAEHAHWHTHICISAHAHRHTDTRKRSHAKGKSLLSTR